MLFEYHLVLYYKQQLSADVNARRYARHEIEIYNLDSGYLLTEHLFLIDRFC